MRNKTLDIIRIFACCAVVFIHFSFPIIGGAIIAIAQAAVPFFFIVSGYFSRNKDTRQLLKKALSLLKLFVIATILSLIVFSLYNLVAFGAATTKSYLLSCFQPKQLLNFLLTNNTHANYSLWFVPSLIYCYLLYALIIKTKLNKSVQYVMAAILLFLQLFLDDFLRIFSYQLDPAFLRNFLFLGFPFFTLGCLIKDFESTFTKTPTPLLVSLSILGALLTVASAWLQSQTLYIGNCVFVFCIFILGLKLKIKSTPKWMDNLFACTTYVYILHVVIHIIFFELPGVFFTFMKHPLWPWIDSIATIVLSFIISYFIVIISNKIKERKKAKETTENLNP